MISIFPMWTFHLYVTTPKQHQYMEYISLSHIPELVVPINFLDRGLLQTRKLLNQGFLLVKLKSSLRKFYGRHHDLIDAMEYLCHKWPRICSTCCKHFPVFSSFMTYHRVCNYINTTGATSGTVTAHPSGAPEFTPRFLVGFLLFDL